MPLPAAREISFAEFAALFAELTVGADHLQREALEVGAKVIEKEAKRVIGTYDYGWPELAESTQDERASLGYEPDEPLLRDGTLRESIEHKVVSAHEAQIGSDLDVAVYQELGTSTIPPRPFLSGAAAAKGQEVADKIGKIIVEGTFAGEAAISGLLTADGSTSRVFTPK